MAAGSKIYITGRKRITEIKPSPSKSESGGGGGRREPAGQRVAPPPPSV